MNEFVRLHDQRIAANEFPRSVETTAPATTFRFRRISHLVLQPTHGSAQGELAGNASHGIDRRMRQWAPACMAAEKLSFLFPV